VLAAACSGTVLSRTTTLEEVARYRAAFATAAGTRFDAVATPAELLARTAGARVLWLGDHHRSTRLHARQRELLAALQRTGRPLLLVLEAIGEEDDERVAAHVAGTLDAAALRAALLRRWPGSWLDDASLDAGHYRALVAFARRHGVPLVGLEPTPRRALLERDEAIAARVAALAAAHPAYLVVVLVGQTHLLGAGDLVGRVGLPSIAIGGEPTELLRRTPPPAAPPGGIVRSDGGIWWFADLLQAAG
jgi:uncharacterized iron-regulated protein